jgi:hypothetical protein
LIPVLLPIFHVRLLWIIFPFLKVRFDDHLEIVRMQFRVKPKDPEVREIDRVLADDHLPMPSSMRSGSEVRAMEHV